MIILPVPQTNPKASYLAHQEGIDDAIQRVLTSGWYILGPEVQAFEKEFAAWCGTGHTVGVANGTDAVELALRGLGIKSGDLIFTVSHTAVATVAAIERTGAVPLLLDVDPATYTIDPNRLETAIQHRRQSCSKLRPTAIVAVHLYGHPAAMDAIMAIAGHHSLAVVEDCAQAHGARLHGQRVGGFGHVAAFSFYPTKNLGCLGDGGAVVCNDPDLADRLREIRQYGWRERYISTIPGLNSRLDELQAAILRVKLPYLDTDNDRRRDIAQRYTTAAANTGLVLPWELSGAEHVYHLYVIQSLARDALARHLAIAGVTTGVHYPAPVHLQAAYSNRNLLDPAGLPVTEALASRILSLPMFPELSEKQINRVCEALAAWHDPA
ncbi:Erythromycin biosynthesis sensory transduction protein EryC1 [Desulfovibrionales bacterium]